jgi:hypothetical protein
MEWREWRGQAMKNKQTNKQTVAHSHRKEEERTRGEREEEEEEWYSVLANSSWA